MGASFLTKPEKLFIQWATLKVPPWMRSEHLTIASIPISIFIIFFSYLATFEINWLWVVSFFIALQWLTDSLDGAVGRHRNQGLVKWGYYMDHFLDYIFLCAILIGYSILLPDHFKFAHFFILAIFGAFMVNAYLAFAATNEFRITYLGIGPTEVRIIFIIINTLLILFGKTYLAQALPYLLVFSFVGLCITVYKTQKYIWNIDMNNKNSL